MASIKVYAPALAISGEEIRDVLEDAGHTVILQTSVSPSPSNPSGFDLLVTQHGTGGAGIPASAITPWLDAGKPVLVVDSANSTSRGVGLTTNHVMLLLGLASTHSRERSYNDLTGVDPDHEVTDGLSDPLLYLNSGATTQGVLDLPLANEAGIALANGDAANGDLEAGSAIVLFESGSIYQRLGIATPLGARVAYLGAGAPTSGVADPTGYSVEGGTLLVRLAEWVLNGVASPAQPVITLSDTTNEAVIGSLSEYAHTGSIPASARYVWLERADGSFIVDPFSIAIDETGFVIEGATENGFIGAQDVDENGLLSVKAVRVAYELDDGDGGSEESEDDGTLEVSEEGTLNMWAWPSALLGVACTVPIPEGMTPYYYRVEIRDVGGLLGSQNVLLSAALIGASFAWLKHGKTYTIRSGVVGRTTGLNFPFIYTQFLQTVPAAFVSPRFDLRHGALVRGAAFSLEWYESPDCLLVGGDDRVELTYDGITFIPITTLNFASNEVGGRVSFVLDSTELTDGRARFSVVRETAGGDAPRRYSPVVFIDNAELCVRIEGEDLLLSVFDVIGGVDEESYWDEFEYDTVPVLRRQGPLGTGGRLVLDVDNPRGFGAVVEGMFAHGGDADSGVFNGLQYLPDTECAWGVSAYSTAARKTLEARFRGFGAAVGTAYSVFEGAPSYNWVLGNIYGRGAGKLEIATHDGSDVTHVQRAAVIRRQYNRVLSGAGRWWQETPWYGVEGFYQQASTTPQALLVQASLHGGETEDEFAPVIEYAAVGEGYPCGDPAVCVLSIARPTTFYLRSFTVYPITYGDCAVGAPEPPTPGSIGLPLEKAWAFPLDGHVFYVLNLTEGNRTFVYDATAGQWAHWFTREQPFWNMFRGLQWRGKVIAGDFTSAKIWKLDPATLLDEGGYQIARAVSGFIPIVGKQSFRQGAMWIAASVGAPTDEGALMRVRFSDDGGNSWSDYFDRVLTSGEYSEVLKYLSHGRIRAPGRLWEITDTGGVVRIDGVEAAIDLPVIKESEDGV